jgi:hypothetical protein
MATGINVLHKDDLPAGGRPVDAAAKGDGQGVRVGPEHGLLGVVNDTA